MRINPVVQPKDVEPAVDWVSGLISAALDKRVAAFEAQERKALRSSSARPFLRSSNRRPRRSSQALDNDRSTVLAVSGRRKYDEFACYRTGIAINVKAKGRDQGYSRPIQ